MLKYKTVFVSARISTKGTSEILEKTLNEYAEKGWKLHSISSNDALGSAFVCVFEREDNE